MPRHTLKPLKVFTYVRVSSDKQVCMGGLPRQRIAILAFLKEQKWHKSYQEFEEPGFSGSIADRPIFSELRQAVMDAHLKGFRTTVVVENTDRLSRTLLVWLAIIEDFREFDCEIYDSSGNNLTVSDDPTQVLLRHIQAAIAQYSKDLLVQRMRNGRERRGVRGGSYPFGRLNADDPQFTRERTVLNMMIHRRFTKWLTYQAIADELNATKGCHPRKAKQWNHLLVRSLLRNERKKQGDRKKLRPLAVPIE